jgi:NAD(P)-dependent dehydrogenase (short-subunit alcohol dehydrogenase family)
MSSTKTILITGVSSGFGSALAQYALNAGHTVVGTVRGEEARQAFEKLDSNRAHGRLLDVTRIETILKLIADVESDIGPIDVLINNAGYGHEGILEESSLEEMRHQFDVNVFGPVAMIKAVLPYMRNRRSGHVVNITSMGGYITMPGIAYYCGSKFALEGISEVLGKEVKDLGIHVTAVAPGSHRTDWAGRSMVRSARTISDYDSLFDPIRKTREERHGQQLGDPEKAAQAILSILNSDNPPQHLLLGSDALGLVRDKLSSLSAEIDQWESLTRFTDN